MIRYDLCLLPSAYSLPVLEERQNSISPHFHISQFTVHRGGAYGYHYFHLLQTGELFRGFFFYNLRRKCTRYISPSRLVSSFFVSPSKHVRWSYCRYPVKCIQSFLLTKILGIKTLFVINNNKELSLTRMI